MDFGNGRLAGNVQLRLLVVPDDTTNFDRNLPKIALCPAVLDWLFACSLGAYFYIDALVGNGRLAAVHWLDTL